MTNSSIKSITWRPTVPMDTNKFQRRASLLKRLSERGILTHHVRVQPICKKL